MPLGLDHSGLAIDLVGVLVVVGLIVASFREYMNERRAK
jgi:hypothetical protein